MKKTIVLAVLTLLSFSAFSQSDSGFGILGGLNFSANGDYIASATEAAENPDRNIGYHIGIFGKLGNRFYVRPELVYTKTKSDYDGDTFDMSKLDAPILVGTKIIGPLHVFAGPAFQYILDSEFDGISIDNIENDFSIGVHIGAGVNLGKLGIDIRYERGMSSNEAKFINNNISTIEESRLDTRPDQIILNLSFKI
ncbi:outer membrane beta-barrel protein [uncultured Maribacter sp.]|uniref:outer membrane beta-barrel protein n=1 Tax=uncultured Maribacter sp. TaxID=431308 RepID=UPI0026289BC1|nr:outer membrane beta-barrel protein [uncultured Maribacter sp.]